MSTPLRIPFSKGRVVSEVMPLCLCCSAWGSMGRCRQFRGFLRPGEKLYAFLDDIYVLCPPARVVEVYGILQAELWRHAGIQINGRKTQVWNQAGVYPRRCEVLEQIAQPEDPEATV